MSFQHQPPENIHSRPASAGHAQGMEENEQLSTYYPPPLQLSAATPFPNAQTGPENHSSATQGVIQRGEAGVHEDIERTATAGSNEDRVSEMYAGNWMRDISQLNVSSFHEILAQTPANLSNPTGPSIGAEGAAAVATGLIRALAMIELGPDITNQFVTESNIGTYTPEQHMDNPMGMRASEILVEDSESGTLRPAENTTEEDDPTARTPLISSTDNDRDLQVSGSAFPGLQVENPELYEVSDTGLGNHIYNSIEWSKAELMTAARLGDTPDGRMHLGTGLHAVEDYFSHSNFVEVALNQEIDRVLRSGAGEGTLTQGFAEQASDGGSAGDLHVDTMYNVSVGDRRAITTSTYGSGDNQVSLTHVLLPKLPELVSAVDGKIDELLGLAQGEDFDAAALRERLQEDNYGLATLELLSAMEPHVSVPVLTGLEFTYGTLPVIGIQYPNGIRPTTEQRGILTGILAYAQTVQNVQASIQAAREFANQLPFPIPGLVELITQIRERVNQALVDLRQRIKSTINQFVFNLIEGVTGLDIPEEKKRSLGDAVDWAHHQVESMTASTSIESRLRGGEADDMDPLTQERVFGSTLNPNTLPLQDLPPSHSEISKDHPEMEAVDSHGFEWGGRTYPNPLGGDEEPHLHEGSLFFELHRQLAIEADRHIIAQMTRVWEADGSEGEDAGGIRASGVTNRENILSDARRFSAAEEERAREAGRSFETGEDEGIEGLPDLMSLVDYFISHPDDSSWWQSILTRYVNANEAQVLSHIRARNQTRANRTVPED